MEMVLCTPLDDVWFALFVGTCWFAFVVVPNEGRHALKSSVILCVYPVVWVSVHSESSLDAVRYAQCCIYINDDCD